MAGYLGFLDSFRPFNYSREAAHFGKNWYVWSGRCLQAIKMRNNYQNISSGEIIYLFSAFKGNFMSDWESQQFSQQSSLLLAPHCSNRQWPKVSVFVARRTSLNPHCCAIITRETRALPCNSCTAVRFFTSATCKECDTNHIPWATA